MIHFERKHDLRDGESPAAQYPLHHGNWSRIYITTRWKDRKWKYRVGFTVDEATPSNGTENRSKWRERNDRRRDGKRYSARAKQTKVRARFDDKFRAKALFPGCPPRERREYDEQHDRENRSAINRNLLRASNNAESEKEECNLAAPAGIPTLSYPS